MAGVTADPSGWPTRRDPSTAPDRSTAFPQTMLVDYIRMHTPPAADDHVPGKETRKGTRRFRQPFAIRFM